VSARLCEHCQTEVEPVAIICSGCGARLRQAREESDWREQVRETVQRHQHKQKIEQARRDDDARQLTIFPELSSEDEEGRVARVRRAAEIRARVEERTQKGSNASRRVSLSESRAPHAHGAAAAAPPRESAADELLDANTSEFDPRSGLPIELELSLPGEDMARLEEPFVAFGLSSPGERILGGLIDLLFVTLIQLTLFYLTTHLVAQRLVALPSSALVAMGVVGGVLAAGYFLFFWSLSGKTLGKLLTGGRIVDRCGKALGFGRAGMRLLGLFLALLPLGAGFLGIWTDAERRGWHDRIAGSKVVRG
jgi:uncharacterized RDD family membrane protein YckC